MNPIEKSMKKAEYWLGKIRVSEEPEFDLKVLTDEDDIYHAIDAKVTTEMSIIPYVIATEDIWTMQELYDVLHEEYPNLADYLTKSSSSFHAEYALEKYKKSPLHYTAYQYVEAVEKDIKEKFFLTFDTYAQDATLEELLTAGPLTLAPETQTLKFADGFFACKSVKAQDFISDRKVQIETIGKAARAEEYAADL